jgi:hypothetical protein
MSKATLGVILAFGLYLLAVAASLLDFYGVL